MERSREYVLERLGSWYSERIEKNYTDDYAKDVRDRLIERLRGTGIPTSPLEGFVSQASQMLFAESFFIHVYPTSEMVVEGRKSRRKEFGRRGVNQFRNLYEFVREVRNLSNRDMEHELTDREIDEIFVKSFSTLGEAFNAFKTFYDALPKIIKQRLDEGKMSEEDHRRWYAWSVISEALSPLIVSKAFDDLKERGQDFK
jgi:hypothetical protein